MNNNYLGKDINIPKEYDPSILSPLSRLESRLKSGLEELFLGLVDSTLTNEKE